VPRKPLVTNSTPPVAFTKPCSTTAGATIEISTGPTKETSLVPFVPDIPVVRATDVPFHVPRNTCHRPVLSLALK
jgi:hypothetical protein